MIAIVISQQHWIAADRCVLVSLPDGYSGTDPIEDGEVLACLRATAPTGSISAERACMVLDDRETFSSLIGAQLAHLCTSADALDQDRVCGVIAFEPVELEVDAGGAWRVPGLPDRHPRQSVRAHVRSSPPASLPYRTVLERDPVYRPDDRDHSVRCCERCGEVGYRLQRDWADRALPALCDPCYEEQTATSQTCEDWCTLPLDHAGLCLSV